MILYVFELIIFLSCIQLTLQNKLPGVKHLAAWYNDNQSLKIAAVNLLYALDTSAVSGAAADYLRLINPSPKFLMTKYTGNSIQEDIRPIHEHFPPINAYFSDRVNVVKLKLRPHAYCYSSTVRLSQLYYQWADETYSYRFWESSRGYLLMTKPLHSNIISNQGITESHMIVMLNHILGSGFDKSFLSRDFKLTEVMKPKFIFSNSNIKSGVFIPVISKDHFLGFLTDTELGFLIFKEPTSREHLRYPDDWLDGLFKERK